MSLQHRCPLRSPSFASIPAAAFGRSTGTTGIGGGVSMTESRLRRTSKRSLPRWIVIPRIFSGAEKDVRRARFIIASLMLAVAAGGAWGQPYPSRPIRLIVPFAAGGPADIQARLVGPKLTEAWGQPVVIENRAGGNTIIATEITARADPDGHVVQVVSAGFAINTSLYARLPYDSVRDFAPVSQMTSGPAIVLVHPSLPARSVKELTRLARSQPGQLTYASAGLPSQLAVELYKVLTGT